MKGRIKKNKIIVYSLDKDGKELISSDTALKFVSEGHTFYSHIISPKTLSKRLKQ